MAKSRHMEAVNEIGRLEGCVPFGLLNSKVNMFGGSVECVRENDSATRVFL